MGAPAYAQLHYGCSFRLAPLSSATTWEDLIKQIRTWLKRICNDEQELAKAWFFTAGRWRDSHESRLRLETDTIVDPKISEPIVWAAYCEHPCKEITHRQWRIDIAVEREAINSFRFSLMIRHWILPGYIGTEPAPPDLSTPGLVSNLLRDVKPTWKATSGGETLPFAPTILRSGYGHLFVNTLKSREGSCPIAYISLAPDTHEPLLNPENLARLIRGTGVVYVAENQDVDEELRELLPDSYRCRRGMIRIFKPPIKTDIQTDYRRHRFYSPDKIKEIGDEEVISQIVKGLCRRTPFISPNNVLTIDGLRSRRNFLRLRELREQKATNTEKYEELLWKELEDKDGEISELQEELQQSEDDAEYALNQAETHEREAANLRYRLKAAEDRASQSTSDNEASKIRAEIWDSITSLPKTLLDVVELTERVWSERLVFHERAKRSAEDYKFDDIDTGWRVFQDIATILYPTYFSSDDVSHQVLEVFNSQSKFELALGEGRQTNQDPKFARMRKEQFQGAEIDIAPHIKYGNSPPKLLRVHFAIHRPTQRIVIGHVGGHLDNYSTRKRK